jgi:hypothetical protein
MTNMQTTAASNSAAVVAPTPLPQLLWLLLLPLLLPLCCTRHLGSAAGLQGGWRGTGA